MNVFSPSPFFTLTRTICISSALSVLVPVFGPLCPQARLDEISQLWQKLIETSSTKRQNLIDAQKREQYVCEVDEVSVWIADREAVASSEDVGKDLEHVEMLQKNFADFMKVCSQSKHAIVAYIHADPIHTLGIVLSFPPPPLFLRTLRPTSLG